MTAIGAGQRLRRDGGGQRGQIDGLLLWRAPFPLHFWPAPALHAADLAACVCPAGSIPAALAGGTSIARRSMRLEGTAIAAGQREKPPRWRPFRQRLSGSSAGSSGCP